MSAGGANAGDRRGLLPFACVLVASIALLLGDALRGAIYLPTSQVHRTVQPWSGMTPDPGAPRNENLADAATVWLPMQSATRGMVREWLAGEGEPPLWCPQQFAGSPWLGNMSSALFSPFTWLFVLLPFEPAFAICAVAKWLVAGCGAWLLARRLGAGPAGRLLAGVAFGIGAFQVVWVHSCLTNVSVLAPWLLLAIERLLERRSAARLACLALATWQVLVGGHPETSLYVGLGAAVYAVVRALSLRSGAALVWLGAGGILGGALALVQWWPFLEYALDSWGHELRLLTGELFRPVWSPFSALGLTLAIGACAGAGLALRSLARELAPPGRTPVPVRWKPFASIGAALAALVCAGVALRATGLRPSLLLLSLPDLWGRSVDGAAYGGPLTYNDVTGGYAGAATLWLALATAVVKWRDPRVRAAAIAALIVAARFLRIPLLSQALDAIPGMGSTGSSRALAMVALLTALLAAIGVGELARERRRYARALIGVLAFFGGVAVPVESIEGARRNEELLAGVDPHSLLWGYWQPDAAEVRAGGEDGKGWSFDLSCGPSTQAVAVTVNGRELGRATPVEAGTGGSQRRAKWRWAGSSRVEDGLYRVTIERIRDDDSRSIESDTWLDLTCAARPGSRWLVPIGSGALLLLVLCLARTGRIARPLLALAAASELLFFASGYQETTPAGGLPAAIEPIPTLQRKRRELGPFRVFTARTHLYPNLPLLFDDPPIDLVRGYDALEPIDYTRVVNELFKGGVAVPWIEMDSSTLDFGGARGEVVSDLLGIRFLVSEEPAPAGFREVWRQQPPRPGQSPLLLHENEDALPRAFLVQRGLRWREPFPDDPRRCAVFDEGDEIELDGYSRLARIDYRRGRIGATVESERGVLLVVTENFGGWSATIDGVESPVRRTHGAFLCVPIEAGGRHEVELRYRPRSVTAGGAVSAGGALLTLLLLFPGWPRRRSTPEA